LNGPTRPGAGSDSDVRGRGDDGWRNDILSSD
jgi:hypothetical protein